MTTVRKEAHLSRATNRLRQLALILRANAGNASGHNLAPLRDEARQELGVSPVELERLVGQERIDLAAPSAASPTATSASVTAIATIAVSVITIAVAISVSIAIAISALTYHLVVLIQSSILRKGTQALSGQRSQRARRNIHPDENALLGVKDPLRPDVGLPNRAALAIRVGHEIATHLRFAGKFAFSHARILQSRRACGVCHPPRGTSFPRTWRSSIGPWKLASEKPLALKRFFGGHPDGDQASELIASRRSGRTSQTGVFYLRLPAV